MPYDHKATTENAQKSDDRRYLDALSENGSFGDVLNFAYELLGRLECVAPPARTLTVWCSSCLPSRPCFVHEEDGGLPPVTEPVNPPAGGDDRG